MNTIDADQSLFDIMKSFKGVGGKRRKSSERKTIREGEEGRASCTLLPTARSKHEVDVE